MADVTAAFITQINANAALVASRAYHVVLPQNPAYPAVTVQQIGGRRISTMGIDPGPVTGRIQVDVWAKGRASCKAAAEQVRTALQRMRGSVGGVTIDGTYVAAEREEYEPDVPTLNRIRFDFMCWWRD